MKKVLLGLFAIPLFLLSCKKNDQKPPDKKRFTVTIENVSAPKMFLGSGIINTPVGQDNPGPITPGKKYQFMVKAGKGQALSFAVMLAATNDLFFAPDDMGIPLYDNNGDPITADVTGQVHLYDAGTEINEEPAVGPNTVTNQSGPNTGPAENGVVQAIGMVTTDHFNYPAVSDVIKVMVEHVADYSFKVTIENVSKPGDLHTSKGDFNIPVSPGVWVVSMHDAPLFKLGEPDRGHGIEAIAEDGNAAPLGEFTKNNTGIVYPLSPGAWAVHDKGVMPIFNKGAKDFGEGLEAIAEDGNPANLGMALKTKQHVENSGVFNTPVGASAPAPLGPGMKYQFSFQADPGDQLSLATMFVQSNDLFYAPDDNGIMLYNGHAAISGDVTSKLYLWDAGTEKNEEPGYGPNQVMRQSAPNTGTTESKPVERVKNDSDKSFDYPKTENIIKVTISAN